MRNGRDDYDAGVELYDAYADPTHGDRNDDDGVPVFDGHPNDAPGLGDDFPNVPWDVDDDAFDYAFAFSEGFAAGLAFANARLRKSLDKAEATVREAGVHGS